MNKYSLKYLLLEYSEKKIADTVERWSQESDKINDEIARKLITRFDQIKSSLRQKIDQVALSDELKQNNAYLDIDKYSLEDMVKLIRSVPENPKKIKKGAIKKFTEEERMDRESVQSYVSRFMARANDLKYSFNNGTEDGNHTKEDVRKFVPRHLHNNEAYLDPRNWKFADLERMLDALFPSYAAMDDSEANTASTDADKIYDKDNVEIYLGNSKDKCVSYNPVEDGRQKYSWCITNPKTTFYDRYRFMGQGDNRMFYFVFDRELPEDNPWHAFVIHVGEGEYKYWVTSANNDADKLVQNWEDIGGVIDPKVWNKIKGLKDKLRFIPPTKAEISQAAMRGKILSAADFRELDYNDKIAYVQANSGNLPGGLQPEILEILDKKLKNVAINNGQQFYYKDLKANPGLAKRYAAFRFRHDNYKDNIIPLPYVQYLDEPAKDEYLKTRDDNLNFDYIRKYFGESQAQNYVNSQVSKLDYLPPSAYDMIQDEGKKKFYKQHYNKLFSNWVWGDDFGIDEAALESTFEMPEQEVDPSPIDKPAWDNLSPNERQMFYKLAKQVDGDPKFSTLLYALPYFIEDGDQVLVLLPSKAYSPYSVEDWVIQDMNGKVVEKGISGDKYVRANELSMGIPMDINDVPSKLMTMDDLNDGPEDLQESKFSTLEYRLQKNAGII